MGRLEIAAIVLVVCLVVVAMLVMWGSRRHWAPHVLGVGGAEGARVAPGGHCAHALGEAVRDHRRGLTSDHRVPPFLSAPPAAAVTGGRPGKPRPWTEFKTWAALKRDPEATAQYNRDKRRVLGGLRLDWSDVTRELGPLVDEPREWAGLINIVDGRPRVVVKRPGPLLGEVELGAGVGAAVPSELVDEICRRPAMFFFHTHPPQGLQAVPSPTDLSMAENVAYTNRYAADLVVSSKGVVMYRPDPEITEEYNALLEGGRRKAARLMLARRSADVLATFAAFRSRKEPWTIREYAMVARKMGIDYVDFPSWRQAHDAERSAFSFGADRDPEDIVEAYQLEMEEL